MTAPLVLQLLLALLLLEGSAPTLVPEEEAAQGEITISFASDDPALGVYGQSHKVPIRSSWAKVDELPDCRVLTIGLSDLPGVGCSTARDIGLAEQSFVLLVAVRMAPDRPVELGRKDDMGVVFRTVAGPYPARGPLGSVTITRAGPRITGTLNLDGQKLKVSGDFSATICQEAPKSVIKDE